MTIKLACCLSAIPVCPTQYTEAITGSGGHSKPYFMATLNPNPYGWSYPYTVGIEETLICQLRLDGLIQKVSAGFWQGVGARLAADSFRLVRVDGRAAGHPQRCQRQRLLAGHLDCSHHFRCCPFRLPVCAECLRGEKRLYAAADVKSQQGWTAKGLGNMT